MYFAITVVSKQQQRDRIGIANVASLLFGSGDPSIILIK